jgi:hypothetical protein
MLQHNAPLSFVLGAVTEEKNALAAFEFCLMRRGFLVSILEAIGNRIPAFGTRLVSTAPFWRRGEAIFAGLSDAIQTPEHASFLPQDCFVVSQRRWDRSLSPSWRC